jgi:hypothetical protein
MKTHVKLNLGIPKDHRLYRDYLNFSYDQVEVKDNMYDKSLTFKQLILPKDYFSGLEIGEIIDELGLVPKIFLIESYHVYNWHRDAFRNIAFNLTINPDTDYIVMFAPDFSIDKSEKNMKYERIEEIRYDSGKFILLNTQVPHITINRGTTNRYLLTIAKYSDGTNALLKKPLDFSEFENTIKYLQEKKLLEN